MILANLKPKFFTNMTIGSQGMAKTYPNMAYICSLSTHSTKQSPDSGYANFAITWASNRYPAQPRQQGESSGKRTREQTQPFAKPAKFKGDPLCRNSHEAAIISTKEDNSTEAHHQIQNTVAGFRIWGQSFLKCEKIIF